MSFLEVETDYVKLAWSELGGSPSRKHRYRIEAGVIES